MLRRIQSTVAPLTLLGLLSILNPALAQEDPKQPPALELEAVLTDESRLLGTHSAESLRVETEFGKTTLRWSALKQVRRSDEKKGKWEFRFRNDDMLLGRPVPPNFSLQTALGELKVPFEKLHSLTLIPTGKAAQKELAKGLVIHFNFNEKKGEAIQNLTKLTKSATLRKGARKNGQLVFDGQEDHVILPNNPAFEDNDTFSISIWTKLHSFGPGGYGNEHGYLVNKGNTMWWNPTWCLGYYKGSGAGRGVSKQPQSVLFTVGSPQPVGNFECHLVSKTKIKPGQWHHLVGTYDGKIARLYLDGKLEREHQYTSTVRRDKAPLLLGGAKLGGTNFGNNFTTDATLDNFRYYKRALEPGEVKSLHKAEKP